MIRKGVITQREAIAAVDYIKSAGVHAQLKTFRRWYRRVRGVAPKMNQEEFQMLKKAARQPKDVCAECGQMEGAHAGGCHAGILKFRAERRAELEQQLKELPPMPSPTYDAVHHPSHYTQGSIECIDGIEAALGKEGAAMFCRGNALKYLWRAGKKGDLVEDLEKARWYLEREIAIRKRP